MKKFFMWMFGVTSTIEGFKKEISDLNYKVECRNNDIDYYKTSSAERLKKIKEHEAAISQYQSNIFNQHNDDINFDFKTVKAVSIERTVKEPKNIPSTVIGYINEDGNIKEWFLHVSQAKHDELLLEFKHYKGKLRA